MNGSYVYKYKKADGYHYNMVVAVDSADAKNSRGASSAIRIGVGSGLIANTPREACEIIYKLAKSGNKDFFSDGDTIFCSNLKISVAKRLDFDWSINENAIYELENAKYHLQSIIPDKHKTIFKRLLKIKSGECIGIKGFTVHFSEFTLDFSVHKDAEKLFVTSSIKDVLIFLMKKLDLMPT